MVISDGMLPFSLEQDFFFEQSPDLLCIIDLEGRFRKLNRTWEIILGYPVDSMTGKSFVEFIHPEDFETSLKVFSEASEGNDCLNFTNRYRCANGSYKWLEWRYKATDDRTLAIAAAREITKRIEIEDQLKMLSAAVEQSPSSIILTDLKANIEYANPKACQTSGFSLAELTNSNARLFKSGLTGKEEYDQLWQSISSGKEWRGVLRNRRKNGDLYWESTSISPIKDHSGKITHYVSVKEDITQKKEDETRLEQLASELKEINSTKDKLFSVIAHDMRGPIGSFSQALEMLSGNMVLDESVKGILMNELKKSSKNIFYLLENLLNWTRIQRGIINLDHQVFILNITILENIELLMLHSGQKSIKVTLNANEIINVFADKDSVDLIIRNLLSNAIKFTPAEGSVSISASTKGNKAVVEIADSGVGIRHEVMDKIFKPAFDQITFGTNGEKGSGLGLILCKDFVERNGGEISFESTEGKGSKFIFTLPLAR